VESVPVVRAPEASKAVSGGAVSIPRNDLDAALEMFRFMFMSREVDRVEMELVNRGEGFFHVGCAGHEASVALHAHLRSDDWLHPHYRDKALMMARGLPADEFLQGLLATAASGSQGRQMCAHLGSSRHGIITMAGPVGNSGLQSVGFAQELVSRLERKGAGGNGAVRSLPVVVCVLGDSASQQGEFLEAVAEAVRARLPVLFLIEDNGYGISTRTAGNTFYHLPSGPQDSFYGIPIRRVDGRDAMACRALFGEVLAEVRTGAPAIVVMEVERLTHHTNADDERVYRDSEEISRLRHEADPIARLRDRLLATGVAEAELGRIEAEVVALVRAAADRSLVTPNPVANRDARPPASEAVTAPGPVPGSPVAEGASFTMLEAMREVLRRQLANDPAVSLFGEDIEDPKGDVFGLTRGLTRAFPAQVKNSALTESTILGVSVGRAMAGGRPVAFIQFADFLPLAFNQIAAEMATVYWRSDGDFRSPVIVLAPCGGYRPGLGPFHAQTMDSTLAHLPGIDVVVPSTAADAAGLLNAAFANQATGRPTVFLYPKVCLNDPGVAATAEELGGVLQPGRARVVRTGGDLTLVGWGSTVGVCVDAASALEEAGVSAEVIDLRTLSPWDRDTVLASAERTGRLVVVQEDNLTGGFGGEVVAAVVEAAKRPVRCRRVARPDTHVPFNYLNQLDLLPGVPEVLAAVAELCDLEVRWEGETGRTDGVHVLEAVGSSPADQTVSVVEWRVKEGDTIRAGDLIADCEADKATFELRAPVGGVIRDLVALDEKVAVGTPIARIEATASSGPASVRRVPAVRRARVSRRAGVGGAAPERSTAVGAATVFVPTPALGRGVVAGLSSIVAVPAGRVVTNEEMIQRFPGRTPDDILQRTGIRSRRLLAPGETALTLAATAARGVLKGMSLGLSDLDAIFVSTSTPISISPSMACLLHHELSQDGGGRDVAASDILAACTGYLYALQAAFDFCRSKPDANILVVTAEAMSEYTDPNDFDTAIVFGDAATATLVHGPSSGLFGASRALLHRPVLSARGEDGTILHHGRRGNPNVNMDGLKVFPMAVRQLIALLKQACAEGEIAVEDLDYIVPHQANGRILDAVDQRLKLPKGRLVNRVAYSGNTSSSTIPIVLAELLGESPKGKAGLCAFGGGFTFGAAVMEWV
jgi:2-oxoisovalerate dehydrogenase E1 component